MKDLSVYHQNLKENIKYVGEVTNLEFLYKLPNPQEGDIYSTKDGEYYVYTENVFKNITQPQEGMNLYHLNQCLIAAEDTLPDVVIVRKIKELNKMLLSQNYKYYMLLSNELKYYTIFRNTNKGKEISFGQAVFECLADFGEIKSYEFTPETNSVEIWVKNSFDNLAHVFYLFPYDTGIIEVKG